MEFSDSVDVKNGLTLPDLTSRVIAYFNPATKRGHDLNDLGFF